MKLFFCFLLLLTCVPPALAAPDDKPVLLKPAIGQSSILQVSLDPPLSEEDKKQGSSAPCVGDSIMHIRDGKLQICLEGKWRDVALHP